MSLEFKLAFPYEVHIIPTVNGGVIARCGCAELSFSSTNKLLQAMREYFADPEGSEKAYYEARKVSQPATLAGGVTEDPPEETASEPVDAAGNQERIDTE
jgi:hypothetical protein